MSVNSQTYKTKITENDNLLSFMVDVYTDTKTIGCNVRLLSECLLEWQNTSNEIKNNNEHQISARDVGLASGVWTLPYPGAPY